MLNQKKVEIFLVKFRKPPTKQFLEVAYTILRRYLTKFTDLSDKVLGVISKNFYKYV